MTSIEWTDRVWNCVVGCSRVSKGCENCYAERVAHRGMSAQHRGLTVVGKHGPRWTGEVRFLPERLDEPLRWKKPARVFVNSMSDLFHERLVDHDVAAVFGVMACAPQHTFQVLTKRPERALAWFRWISESAAARSQSPDFVAQNAAHTYGIALPRHAIKGTFKAYPWPLPNVHLLVSVEDQQTADERIPLLLECPAAHRGVSYEPAIGPVHFDERWLLGRFDRCELDGVIIDGGDACEGCPGHGPECAAIRGPSLHWIIIGGESGPRARPFDLAWARSTIAQCRAAGVPCFVKQLGARPVEALPGPWASPPRVLLRDRKGGDMGEWPEDLRVREFPEARS